MLGLLAATLLLGGCTGQHTTRTAASTTYTPHIKASSQDVLDAPAHDAVRYRAHRNAALPGGHRDVLPRRRCSAAQPALRTSQYRTTVSCESGSIARYWLPARLSWLVCSWRPSLSSGYSFTSSSPSGSRSRHNGSSYAPEAPTPELAAGVQPSKGTDDSGETGVAGNPGCNHSRYGATTVTPHN